MGVIRAPPRTPPRCQRLGGECRCVLRSWLERLNSNALFLLAQERNVARDRKVVEVQLAVGVLTILTTS